MTALFEKVYVHVMNDYPPIMQFTVFFFTFLQSHSIPIFWVVSLDVDFILKPSFSISVDPGSLSPSRLNVMVSRYNSIDG